MESSFNGPSLIWVSPTGLPSKFQENLHVFIQGVSRVIKNKSWWLRWCRISKCPSLRCLNWSERLTSAWNYSNAPGCCRVRENLQSRFLRCVATHTGSELHVHVFVYLKYFHSGLHTVQLWHQETDSWIKSPVVGSKVISLVYWSDKQTNWGAHGSLWNIAGPVPAAMKVKSSADIFLAATGEKWFNEVCYYRTQRSSFITQWGPETVSCYQGPSV